MQAHLESLRERSLLRSRLSIDGPQGPRISIGQRELLNFSANDYLSLASDPRVIEALRAGAARYGAGAGASQLICGRSLAHEKLENELAAFLKRDRALLFSSGYLANLAVATSLVSGREDLIAGDRRNHASLNDAALLARARFRRYAHADADALRTLLSRHQGPKLVLTDGVFSMDGDTAPLPGIAAACRDHRALLAVDDAHGFAVMGDTGRGSLETAGLGQAEVPLLVGTLGKALGSSGAFVAGAHDLIETIIQSGRSYIYTTGPSPALMAAASRSLEIVEKEQPYRRLHELILYFRRAAGRAGLPLAESTTPIQPLVLGDPAAALRASERLRERGIFVAAIRPPTVPANSSRLRISLSSGHTEADLDRLVEGLSEVVRQQRPELA